MILKRLLRDSGIYIASRLITGLGQIVLLPFYTAVLSPTEYGALDLVGVLSSLVGLTIALEITQAVVRFVPDNGAADRKRIASTALAFTVATNVGFVLLAWGLAPWLSAAVFEGHLSPPLVQLAAVGIALTGLLYALQTQLRAELKPLAFAVSAFVQTAVSIAVSAWLVLVAGWGVAGMLYGLVLGSAVATIYAFTQLRGSLAWVWDHSWLKRLLQFSLPLVPSSVGVFFALYMDRILVKELLSVADLGVYGIAYRLATVAGLAISGFQSSLTPLVYTHHQDPNTPKQLATLMRVFLWVALSAYLGACLLGREVVGLLAASQFAGAGVLLAPVVLAAFVSNLYLFVPGLWIAKRTLVIALLSGVVALSTLVLNYVFIALWGLPGAPWATLAAAALGFGLQVAFGLQYYPVPHPWLRLLSVTGLVLLAGVWLQLGWVGLVLEVWLKVGIWLLMMAMLAWGLGLGQYWYALRISKR